MNVALSRNRYLVALPDQLGDLRNLRSFACNDCKLAKIPVKLHALTSRLRDLDLSTNAITSLPTTIGNIVSLESLYLSRNRLVELPASIGHLTRLQELCVEENSIKVVCPELGRCQSLRMLNLHLNGLSNLPDELGKLGDLETLTLEGNAHLKHISDAFSGLTSLQRLTLDVELLGSFSTTLLSWATTLKSLEFDGGSR